MPSRRLPSRRLRVAGIASPVVLDLLGKNRGDYFQSMRLDDMDYSAMREVYNLVRNRRGTSVDRFIDRYNETYFRELV